jgi:alkylation response protein AidB-like acyl-CoA dehydrogenase
MNFDFSPEQTMLRDQARKFLQAQCDLKRVRRVLDGKARWDAEIWREIGRMGWCGTAIPEAYGGAGASAVDLCVLAEEIGRAVAPVPFSSTVYLFAEAVLLAGSEAQKSKLLPKLAAGELIGTLAVAEGPRAPNPRNLALQAGAGKLTGEKLPVADGDMADMAIVLARTASDSSERNASLFLVDLKAAGVKAESIATVDPTRPHARLVFDGAGAEPLGAAGEGWRIVREVLDRAAVLFAFEQLGGAEAALEMAKAYALERIAFGRPIGSFQAIKHKLAEVYIQNQLARSNAYYGAWALAVGAPELPIAAAAARVAASEAFHLASKENIQTHGGMGFTWEFDCHLYYRRAKVLALALGSSRRWKETLITRIEARNAH